MAKQVIRLTEGDLHRIIENSVKRYLNEIGNTSKGQYMLGRLHAAHKYLGKDDTDDIRNYASDSYEKNKENFPKDENIFSVEDDNDLPFPLTDDNYKEPSMDFYNGDLDFYDDIGQGPDSYSDSDIQDNNYYQDY